MFHVVLSCRLGFVTLVLILGLITLAGCVRRVVSVDEVDKMIRHQVPVGSDKQQVKAFIDNLKVDSLRIWRGDFYPASQQPPVGTWEPAKIKELWPRIAEFTGARIIDAQSGFLNHNDIVIQFAIDRNGGMIGYAVKLEGTE